MLLLVTAIYNSLEDRHSVIVEFSSTPKKYPLDLLSIPENDQTSSIAYGNVADQLDFIVAFKIFAENTSKNEEDGYTGAISIDNLTLTSSFLKS